MKGGECILLLLFAVAWVEGRPEDIELENGGYKGILVSIDDNVPFDPDFLQNLKDRFVDGSEALYRATEYDDINNSGRLDLTSAKHFAEITVIVPKSWPRIEGCSTPTSELAGNADFRVRVESPQYGKLLHTHMVNSDCREPGEYTIIPESFIRDPSGSRELYGPELGKAILHEWAMLRWGLREESNYKDGGDTCILEEDWNLMRYRRPIRCSTAVNGASVEDPDDESKCIFIPGPDSPSATATASIMYMRLPFYSNMYTFCDSRHELADGSQNNPHPRVLHDAEAEHAHNKVCNRQSAWQVLRDHPDFDPDEATSIDFEFDFEANLNFQCVQERQQIRIVLVLDTSGSMDGARMEQMRGDVALFLQTLEYEQAEVGMLHFASSAIQLVPIIPLDSDANRDRLLNAIPSVAVGGTSIGSGIQLALQMLEAGGQSAAGGLIMTFTDGEENESPFIVTIRPEVLNKEAIVHGLLLAGQTEDHDLIKLALETGGSYCIYEDSGNGGNDYYQCLMDIIADLVRFTVLEVKTEDLVVPSGGSSPGSALIDASFEDSLRFTLSWTSTTYISARDDSQPSAAEERQSAAEAQMALCTNVEMVVTAPDGTTIMKGDPRYDEQSQFRLITIDASGFKEGEWQYEVMSPGSACNARLRIEGFPDTSSPDDAQQPILMTTRVSKLTVDVQTDASPLENTVTLFVEIKQGMSPVLGAEVEAKVESGAYSQTVILKDNGAGADNVADDSVYSAYFYEYAVSGVYSVRAFARGVSGQTEILRETRELQEDWETGSYTVVRAQSRLPVAAFERAAIGGAFEVATNGVSDMNSIIPPARINDFRRGEMGSDRVELLWTAVGASMMDGTASAYDIRVCTSPTQKFSNCTVVEQAMFVPGFNLSSPQPSGAPESASISLEHLATPPPDTSYYVVIQAVDAFGNLGAASNLAVVQGPVSREKNSAAIIAGSLACVAVLGTAVVGGALVYRNKKNMQLHPTV